MEQQWIIQALINIPVGAALVWSITAFLRHIAAENKANRDMFTNHLSLTTTILGDLKIALDNLRAEFIAHDAWEHGVLESQKEQR